MPIVNSACPLDCPDACSLAVTVDNGRVTKVDGDNRNPMTQNFICAKVRRMPEYVYSADRIGYPLIRAGSKGEGRFRRAGWNEALMIVGQKLLETRMHHGGEAILPFSYGGSNGMLTEGTVDHRLWRRLGASQLLRTVCAAPSGAAVRALYGAFPGVALPDYPQSKFILVWGCNPHASGIHLVPALRDARARGAKLVVVDPRRTGLADEADAHLAIRPGTDLPLALAIANRLFETRKADLDFLRRHADGVDAFRQRAAAWPVEKAARECGVEAAEIAALADAYAAASPAVIRCGWGPERNRNGASAIAAILALPAVAGKFGRRGGGYTLSNSRFWSWNQESAIHHPAAATREVNMNQLGDALLNLKNPPVHFLFVYNANPLVTVPAQNKVRAGLEREDLFTVVYEQVMTDTARYADVVLPATTFLEHDELSRGYGSMVVHRSRPAIPPVGEARPNVDVFGDLLKRTGLAEPDDPRTPEELVAAICGATPHGERIGGALAEHGIAYPQPDMWPERAEKPGATPFYPVQFRDIFPATAGKAQLAPPDMLRAGMYDYRPDPATAEYPIALLSAATDKTINSTLGNLRKALVGVQLHPEDAAARGIRDGMPTRIFNAQGDVIAHAVFNAKLRRGVAYLPKGLWCFNTLNGRTATTLAPDTLSDFGGGACFNDARVQLAPALQSEDGE